MKSISTALRTAIANSNITAAELSRSAGVPQPTITRFLAGADLRVSNVDKLAAYLGMELIKPKRRKLTE